VAKAVAGLENDYIKLPKSGGIRKTTSFEDVLVLAGKVKADNPNITTQQVMQWVSDIYKAGGELNNKYMAPEVFGLPKQTSYVIEIDKESTGASVLNRITSAATLAADANSLGVGPAVRDLITKDDAGAATRAQTFRKNYRDAFTGIYGTEKIDLFKTNDLVMMALRANPTLWADKK
jgi:hypothetical protein